MEQKTFHIQTFGCQMNERDSETLAGMLIDCGYAENPVRNNADVIIVNTCSVRDNADKRFFGTLGQIKKVKEKNPELITCVCGCMMQQQHVVDTVRARYPWVDLVFGTHNIHEFPELLERLRGEKKKLVDVWPEGGEIVEGLPSSRKYPFKSFVNIMYGCNNFCTYCIVPYTRGRERSRKPSEILREVRELAADGVKEVTLLGQNVNSYRGRESEDQEKPMDFAGLLHELNGVPGLSRIRFMTSHPKDLSDHLIRAYGECNKLCRHIHLPVQSGSSRILKAMNRHYDKEDYLTLVERLRAAVPDIAITTDIIVGFPGETEEDFEETMDLVRKVRFDSAFTFLYSVRKGTPAASFEEQIPEAVKHERFNRLVDGVNAVSAEKNRAMVGHVVDVLAEGDSKNGKASYTGRTGGHKLINFDGEPGLTGKVVPVLVTDSNTFSLVGRQFVPAAGPSASVLVSAAMRTGKD